MGGGAVQRRVGLSGRTYAEDAVGIRQWEDAAPKHGQGQRPSRANNVIHKQVIIVLRSRGKERRTRGGE